MNLALEPVFSNWPNNLLDEGPNLNRGVIFLCWMNFSFGFNNVDMIIRWNYEGKAITCLCFFSYLKFLFSWLILIILAKLKYLLQSHWFKKNIFSISLMLSILKFLFQSIIKCSYLLSHIILELIYFYFVVIIF